MIWNDINIFKRDYTNGIKKVDGVTDDYKDLQNAKLKHNTKAFDITPEISEYGLEDRYTIRPFKLNYDHSLKDLFKNKCTPSSVLNGKVNLSTGTKEIIKMTNKLIPKIDHSTIDPGYYEHKLNNVKSNKDLMMKRLSNADAFAKSFVTDLKKKKSSDGESLDGEAFEMENIFPSPSQLTHTSRIPLSVEEREAQKERWNSLKALPVSPVQNDESEEDSDEEKNNAIDKRVQALKQKKALKMLQGMKERNAIKKARKEGRKRSNSLSESVVNYLEASDSESETEQKTEQKTEEPSAPKPEGKKKKQSKDEKEDSHKKHISSLTPDMLNAGIKAIEKEIEEYKKENKKHVILKESSDDLNKKIGLYGLKFKTGTSVSSVLKKLNDHKIRLENEYGLGQLQGRLKDLGTDTKHKESTKIESKEV